jgi:replicative DNA helicase
MTMAKNNQIPYSNTSEQALLGSILAEPKNIYELDTKPDEFYKNQHAELWQCMLDHSLEIKDWDMVTLSEYLNKEGKGSDVGGYVYLIELQDCGQLSYNFKRYANQVRELYEIRREIRIYQEALENCFEGSTSTDTVIAKLMSKPVPLSHDPDRIVYEWREASKGNRSTIPTPYESMDRQTGGIKQGMVTLFTGRSKSGKSMFLSSWYNYLGQRDIPILVVPLEDKYNVTIKRMASNLGCINTGMLDTGGTYERVGSKWTYQPTCEIDIEKGESLLKQVSKYPVHFYDRKCTPKQLRGIAIRHKRKHDIQAMFIDGAKDLLRPSGKYGDVGFDEEISQQMCAIAEELNIAVIAIHHLTKLSDDERITVNHIRGSGNIVGDSRAVYALQSSGIEGLLADKGYHPSYDENGRLKTRIFECLSNNHGGTGMKALDTDLNRCQFYELRK